MEPPDWRLFTETEQALLRDLTAVAPECATWSKATLHPNCTGPTS
ncbi:hypothetical protein [Massilia glaciei]|nr:hypothetical protein [Massilia glaciei]